MNMFKKTNAKTPKEYIELIAEPRKSEILKLFNFIQKILPNEKPFILVGMIEFVPFHYKSKSGREGDWSVIALASQKNYISLYVCAVDPDSNGTDGKQYVAEKYKDKLPKASIGRSCIRFKKMEDIDLKILEKVIREGVESASKHGFAI